MPSHIFPDMAWGDTFDRATLAAERGDIVSHGAVVATNVRLVTVYALLSEIAPKNVLTDEIMQENAGMSEQDAEKEADRLYSDAEYLNTRFSAEFDAAAAEIAAVLDLDAAELRTKFGKNTNEFITVYQAMPDEVTVEQQEQLNAVNGVHVDTEHYGSKRYYPYGSLLAHTLGYISFATWEEIQTYNEGRDPNDGLYTTDSKVGKSGIEKLYERELRGKDGYYFFIRGTDGAVKKVIYRKDKVDGSDVMLTIDFKLQQRTEELLDLVLFGTDTAGAVVVMNPKTGEVNAIASNPSYDLNRFIKGMSGDEYKALEDQENEPLRNRAARELYPPGSTFKAFTAAAALDTGTVNENYVFTGYIDNDYWKPTGYGEWPWPRIKRTRVYHRTEPMNMTNCMLHSDNIYFADVALKIGQEKFIAYFNEKLGMDKSLPYELGAARSQLYSRGSVMDNKMLADSGYGQGQVLVTPLQLAAMFSAFANNGDMPTPRITDGLYITDGVEYKCIRKSEYSVWMEDAISTNAINKIVPMLQGVVDPNKNGTGRSLRVTNVDVAAKTGSAEIGKDKTRMYSWFAGFRLNVAQEDERVVIVMLDVPDSGAYSSLKFQIARELLKLDDTPDPNAPPAE
jgi:cell division protein FtsI/penicillin-binding protein 2